MLWWFIAVVVVGCWLSGLDVLGCCGGGGFVWVLLTCFAAIVRRSPQYMELRPSTSVRWFTVRGVL